VPLVFHDFCNCPSEPASVRVSTFTALLDWLQPRAASGTVVKTVREVITPDPGYARPKGASPLRLSLVPAYDACTAPDSNHGAPLASPSCTGPRASSDFLTIGTADANGQPANSSGAFMLRAVPGDTSTSTDDADVRIDLSITDVRKLSDLTDYGGQLAGRPRIRLTDKVAESSTISDFDLELTVPCTATSDTTTGASCSLLTTADAVKPGMVKEGARAIWALEKAVVDDGGPDGVASTHDNTPFAVQGIFAP
jgi:hypothetical protein